MKAYSKDTGAAAVVLFDKGKTYFEYNDTRNLFLIHERHTRIKILKKEGFNQGNIEIPFFFGSGDSYENIQRIKAVCYNLEGGKVVETEVEKKDIYEDAKTKNYKFKKFSIPGIKEGSVIEISYRINSDFLFYLREWKFQRDIPVIWSEYEAIIPEFFDYKMFPVIQIPFAVNKRDFDRVLLGTDNVNGLKYHWVVKDAPAFKDEKFITTEDDYITKVEFQLNSTYFQGITKTVTGSWENVGLGLIKDEEFGKQLNKKGMIKDVVASLTSGISEPEKKARVIYDYVRENIKWNEESSIYVKNNVKKVLDAKRGNSAEINFLLISMLREAGIEEAYPVVLSTRSNGKLNPIYPRIDRLNYVVVSVRIGEKNYLMDATQPLLPMGMLPFKALNLQGKLISEKGIAWVDLYPKTPAAQVINVMLKLTEDEKLSGEMTLSIKDYAAYLMRNELKEKTEGKKENNNKKKETLNFTIKESKLENEKNIYEPLKLIQKIELDDEFAGDKLYLDPFLVKYFKENPFKQEERKFPVDFGHPLSESYSLVVTMPEGYDVEELPKSVNLITPDKSAGFSYAIGKSGNVLQLRTKMNIDRPVYLPEEYEELREFITQVIAKQSEQIVLKKVAKN